MPLIWPRRFAGCGSAKQHSDLLVAALHAHEPLHDALPPAAGEFVGEFGRAAIDAGADVVVTSGIHHLAGIELYGGGAIFHGLGNFVFSDLVEPLPHELYAYGREHLRRAFDDPARRPTPTSRASSTTRGLPTPRRSRECSRAVSGATGGWPGSRFTRWIWATGSR